MADLADLLAFAASAFAAVFTIVNPVGNLSFFVTATQGYAAELKGRIIHRIVTVATATLFVFAVAGNYIFLVFHTSIHAFRIAGGLLLFSIAFAMMHGERSRTQLTDRDREEALSREVLGVVPLGIPMFAGPGAITTVIVLMGEATVPVLDPLRVTAVFAAVLLTMGISYALLHRADWVARRFGRMGLMAFSRLMGLLLAAIAVQIILIGLRGAYLEYFAGLP